MLRLDISIGSRYSLPMNELFANRQCPLCGGDMKRTAQPLPGRRVGVSVQFCGFVLGGRDSHQLVYRCKKCGSSFTQEQLDVYDEE